MYDIDLPKLLFLTLCGVSIVLCKGIKCDSSKEEYLCTHGCCGGNSTQKNIPANDENIQMPSFTIFFYALVIFIFFLLVVCCVGKFARLKNGQGHRPRPATIRIPATGCARRRPSERVVVSIIELILRENENRSRNGLTNDIDPTNISIGGLIKGPPTYDEVVKEGTLNSPPSYEEIDYSTSNVPGPSNSRF